MSLPTNTWLSQAIIYQLFAGRWSTASLIQHPFQVFNRLSQLDYSPLADRGINTLYLLGIFDNRGPIIVNHESGQDITRHPQRLPSPFAISDHQSPNPFLGSVSDLKHLVDKLHHQGLKVILDFVPNHTSTSHPWVKSHPEYYYFNQGQPIAEFNSDVYKLNYQNPDLRQAMFSVIQTLASWGVDGLRCDMAHLIPLDFWQEAIHQTKTTRPDFVFIAEAYPDSPFDLTILRQLLDSGFDAVYHGLLHKNLEQVITHHQPLDYLTGHLDYILHHFPASQFINFVANHDDPLPDGAGEYLEALLALILFLPGTSFLYNGLLCGFSRRLAHHYFDELSLNFQETSTFPRQFQPLFDLKQKLQPQITRVSLQANLILCTLNTTVGSATLYLNPSPDAQVLPPSHLSGHLHQFKSGSLLPPGHAELFLK